MNVCLFVCVYFYFLFLFLISSLFWPATYFTAMLWRTASCFVHQMRSTYPVAPIKIAMKLKIYPLNIFYCSFIIISLFSHFSWDTPTPFMSISLVNSSLCTNWLWNSKRSFGCRDDLQKHYLCIWSDLHLPKGRNNKVSMWTG